MIVVLIKRWEHYIKNVPIVLIPNMNLKDVADGIVVKLNGLNGKELS